MAICRVGCLSHSCRAACWALLGTPAPARKGRMRNLLRVANAGWLQVEEINSNKFRHQVQRARAPFMTVWSSIWLTASNSEFKKRFTLFDLCASSLRRCHANLLCIVPILTDDPRRESLSCCFIVAFTLGGVAMVWGSGLYLETQSKM